MINENKIMANKVQKIREEVEKLKSQLLRGACSSQVAMETRCKEEAYNEVLALLDTMQEEYNITGIKSRHATGKLKECIDNQTEEGLEQARKQLEEESINDSDISCDAELCFAHTGCKYYNPNKRNNVNHCIGGLPLQLMQIKQKTTTSVWHDASEKPKEGSWICVSFASRDLSTFFYEDGKIHNNYVDVEMIGCKWAYPEDLLKL